VITTAAIPGRPSPKILTRAMIEGMKPGSVIVDIAAEGGGNCELTQPGQVIEHQGVTIAGPLNVPSMQPIHASDMYARNLLNYLSPFLKAGELKLDFNDEIIAKSCVTHLGEIKHEPTRKLVEA
jgi:H+-translocating NAD(P) transhydrogenase subunit alpha